MGVRLAELSDAELDVFIENFMQPAVSPSSNRESARRPGTEGGDRSCPNDDGEALALAS